MHGRMGERHHQNTHRKHSKQKAQNNNKKNTNNMFVCTCSSRSLFVSSLRAITVRKTSTHARHVRTRFVAEIDWANAKWRAAQRLKSRLASLKSRTLALFGSQHECLSEVRQGSLRLTSAETAAHAQEKLRRGEWVSAVFARLLRARRMRKKKKQRSNAGKTQGKTEREREGERTGARLLSQREKL